MAVQNNGCLQFLGLIMTLPPPPYSTSNPPTIQQQRHYGTYPVSMWHQSRYLVMQVSCSDSQTPETQANHYPTWGKDNYPRTGG